MNLRQRLGQNRAGYAGERIDIGAVLGDIRAAARGSGWDIDDLPLPGDMRLLALRRRGARPGRRLYLSAGIHGDEPAGPLAMLDLLRANRWPADTDLWLCPCLNPAGYLANRRENPAGFDLNRDYRHLESAETRAHVDWLRQQPDFHLALCLHEDWEAHGFYLYELNPDHQPSLGESIIQAVAAVCPIDPSPEIEGRPAHGGIIRPDLDPAKRPEWPEAFYLVSHKTRHSYTLEAPSDFALSVRVAALQTAVRVVLTRDPDANPR
jgi:murein peptide amidase A